MRPLKMLAIKIFVGGYHPAGLPFVAVIDHGNGKFHISYLHFILIHPYGMLIIAVVFNDLVVNIFYLLVEFLLALRQIESVNIDSNIIPYALLPIRIRAISKTT